MRRELRRRAGAASSVASAGTPPRRTQALPARAAATLWRRHSDQGVIAKAQQSRVALDAVLSGLGVEMRALQQSRQLCACRAVSAELGGPGGQLLAGQIDGPSGPANPQRAEQRKLKYRRRHGALSRLGVAHHCHRSVAQLFSARQARFHASVTANRRSGSRQSGELRSPQQQLRRHLP